MAHRVHRVMRLVAVECPVAGVSGVEFDGAHLSDCDVGGHLGPARRLRHPAAIRTCYLELMSVQMNGMIGHRQVADANAHAIALAHDERVDARERPAVERPDIEVEHGAGFRRKAAGIDVVGVEQEHKIAIDAVQTGILRVRDPKAHHAHGHLRHFIGVRVIHERAGTRCNELIDESLARPDRRLVQPGNAIHAIGQALAMPVNTRMLGQVVGDEEAHLVAFDDFDRWSRRLAVVAP